MSTRICPVCGAGLPGVGGATCIAAGCRARRGPRRGPGPAAAPGGPAGRLRAGGVAARPAGGGRAGDGGVRHPPRVGPDRSRRAARPRGGRRRAARGDRGRQPRDRRRRLARRMQQATEPAARGRRRRARRRGRSTTVDDDEDDDAIRPATSWSTSSTSGPTGGPAGCSPTAWTRPGIAYRWEETTLLVVAAKDEAAVEALLDELEYPDALPADEDADETRTRRPFELMSDLFLAADRLKHNTTDPDGIADLASLVEEADARPAAVRRRACGVESGGRPGQRPRRSPGRRR